MDKSVLWGHPKLPLSNTSESVRYLIRNPEKIELDEELNGMKTLSRIKPMNTNGLVTVLVFMACGDRSHPTTWVLMMMKISRMSLPAGASFDNYIYEHTPSTSTAEATKLRHEGGDLTTSEPVVTDESSSFGISCNI